MRALWRPRSARRFQLSLCASCQSKRGKCILNCKSGKRCRNYAEPGHSFCRYHLWLWPGGAFFDRLGQKREAPQKSEAGQERGAAVKDELAFLKQDFVKIALQRDAEAFDIARGLKPQKSGPRTEEDYAGKVACRCDCCGITLLIEPPAPGAFQTCPACGWCMHPPQGPNERRAVLPMGKIDE